MDEHLWYKNAVFYQIYIRAFYDSNGDGIGDLNGIVQKMDYLHEFGMDCIWLMPFYPSPRKDDGYDIVDYYNIHPDSGTLEDFKALLRSAHERGIRVITDLVLNHTSDQHPWFQSARTDRRSLYRDYYVWADSDTKYGGARIIFLDTEKSNWSWDESAGQYFWHRFYKCQPDLNFDNPRVQDEMINVIKFWLDLGVDGFRVDAVPYLFEREGTNCENLPETHAYLRKIRRFVDEHYTGRILLCEANQWPRDVRPYFGEGDEFQMAFHFPLMPRIFMALGQNDASPIARILEQTPPLPENCQWCTFLRNHDELTLEMVTETERQWMWATYAPEPRMRLNLGIRRRLAPLLGNDRRKIELANALAFTLPGTPVLYYGDEIGMGDNIWLSDRNGVRTPMQWDSGFNGGFSESEKTYAPVIAEKPFAPQQVNLREQRSRLDSLWQTLKELIANRKRHPALFCGSFTWLDCANNSVAAYLRVAEDETFLVVNNLAAETQVIELNLPLSGLESAQDILGGEVISLGSSCFTIVLNPFQYSWFKITPINLSDADKN